MKRLTLIGLFLALVSGCATQPASLKSFSAFREQVANELSTTCDCGPIHRGPINGCIFDIRPRQQREFSVRVWECEFLTQEEWDRNYSSATNRESEIDFTKLPSETREQVARAEAAERWSLPDGSYNNIGISIELQWPEMKPGEWGKQNEVNKDRGEVVRYMDQIERLLKLYHRPSDGHDFSFHTMMQPKSLPPLTPGGAGVGNGFARACSLSPSGIRPQAQFLSPFPKGLKSRLSPGVAELWLGFV